MKYIFVAFCLLSLSASAQYRESGDTIFINDHILLPGDTVHLGLGSDPYKNFVFISQYPTKQNFNLTTLSVPVLQSDYAYGFLIYAGRNLDKKSKTYIPYFYAKGIKNPLARYCITFPGAIGSKEILL